jgi:hypothetical protein
MSPFKIATPPSGVSLILQVPNSGFESPCKLRLSRGGQPVELASCALRSDKMLNFRFVHFDWTSQTTPCSDRRNHLIAGSYTQHLGSYFLPPANSHIGAQCFQVLCSLFYHFPVLHYGILPCKTTSIDAYFILLVLLKDFNFNS